MNRMEGKVAIVTGGARGIGRQIVETLAQEGAAIVYSLDMGVGEYQLPNVRHVQLNVTNRDQVAKFVEDVKTEFEKIDVLVNNAGITRDALIQKMTEDMWDAVIDVNLKGVFNLTQAVAPIMMENGKGSIVSISSVVGVYGNVGQTNYAATKAGVIGMTYTWAKEFTRKGAAVRSNAIAPGYVETEMMATVPDKVLQPIREKTPLGRLGQPQEIANAVLFLASDESSYVNGHVLEVTGGLRL
ncbi:MULTISPECIES: beta-ketoacyl-ACP reductase [unclassified Mesobacillus]|jgi:3-oxoacyl-[acyl-carrier protein] reductase|uniref:beta-ketoacyl-ACP reductase n=1 Tax=unclassified Mesobacillus TaxID=2675270 RepID=UPI00203B1E3F|nr:MULTISPECIES: beta-ketoacyl-ACP reductase [unclassified Mesobacillus]MCM3125091.1 beta-ketoacyl-ACP reductase [Mesobacillus sp. MER 33]MCM3235149.1 beta-ketoacyl-ACP reductase [Mesobacillus sp. MER 48]